MFRRRWPPDPEAEELAVYRIAETDVPKAMSIQDVTQATAEDKELQSLRRSLEDHHWTPPTENIQAYRVGTEQHQWIHSMAKLFSVAKDITAESIGNNT
jgi:hypothetical protein